MLFVKSIADYRSTPQLMPAASKAEARASGIEGLDASMPYEEGMQRSRMVSCVGSIPPGSVAEFHVLQNMTESPTPFLFIRVVAAAAFATATAAAMGDGTRAHTG